MILSCPIYPSRVFTWKGNSAVSDVSDMHAYASPQWSQLYDDACDVGFAIESDRTGKVVRFSLGREEFSGHGEDKEVVGWNFISICGKYKILVVND